MKNFTLAQRLTLVFTVLLIACCALSAYMQVLSSNQYSQSVIQRLSANLATQIAANNPLLSEGDWDPKAVHTLFDQLMAVNPSVEVYLLDKDGHIVGNAAPAGRLQQKCIDLAPVNALLHGAKMPVYGDNPRDPHTPQVFSAAPLLVNGETQGYVYCNGQLKPDTDLGTLL